MLMYSGLLCGHLDQWNLPLARRRSAVNRATASDKKAVSAVRSLLHTRSRAADNPASHFSLCLRLVRVGSATENPRPTVLPIIIEKRRYRKVAAPHEKNSMSLIAGE